MFLDTRLIGALGNACLKEYFFDVGLARVVVITAAKEDPSVVFQELVDGCARWLVQDRIIWLRNWRF